MKFATSAFVLLHFGSVAPPQPPIVLPSIGRDDSCPGFLQKPFFFVVILEKPIRIPRSLSVKASSCIKGFLNKDPRERLGCHLQTGFGDIMSHLFFRAINWDAVFPITYLPPLRLFEYATKTKDEKVV